MGPFAPAGPVRAGAQCSSFGAAPCTPGSSGVLVRPGLWDMWSMQAVEGTDVMISLSSCCIQRHRIGLAPPLSRDACPERGFVFEEALVLLLRREFGLAFSLDASPRSCFVYFFLLFYFSGVNGQARVLL